MSIAVRFLSGASPLAPFLRPAGALPVVDGTLQHAQDRVAAALGLTVVEQSPDVPVPPGTVLAFDADVWFTAAMAEALCASPCQAAAVQPDTALGRWTVPLSGLDAVDGVVAMPLWGGAALEGTRADLAALPPLLTGAPDAHTPIRVAPYGPAPHTLNVPSGAMQVAVIRHWMHLLNVNQTALLARRTALGAVNGRTAILKNARSGTPETVTVTPKPAKVHAGVHPAAYVADALIADDAEIESGASVLRSYIGPGVRVADQAVLADCVIAEDCQTLVDTHLRRVVALPGSTLSNLGLEDVALGANVFVTTAVSFYGHPVGENITVDGADSGRATLSGAIGCKSIVGARALVTAGKAIPPDVTVVMRPDEGAVKLDDAGLARAHMRRLPSPYVTDPLSPS